MGRIMFIIWSLFILIPSCIYADDCIQALRAVRKTNLPTLPKDEVISGLDEAIKLCPKLVEAYYEYGRFYLINSQFK